VDLETAATNAVGGRSNVISIFGKRVPKVSRKYQDDSVTQREDISSDGNISSPWSVKVKEGSPAKSNSLINKNSGANHIVCKILSPTSQQVSSPTSADMYVNQSVDNCPQERVTPAPHHVSTPIDVPPSPNVNIAQHINEVSCKDNFCLSQGDIIDLHRLPRDLFHTEDTTIVSISNKKNNRSQVAVLGSDILLIASKMNVGTNEEGEAVDLANVLWYTPRS